MAETFTWVIRVIHILAGVMWVGGAALWGMVIGPSLAKRVPPPARGPFMAVVLPRLVRYFGIAGVVTVISGLWVMGLINGGFSARMFEGSDWAMTLGAAFVVALFMLGIAVWIIVITPKLLGLMAAAQPGTPPGPEAMALQSRVIMLGRVNLALGVIALGLMAWAVNLREYGVA